MPQDREKIKRNVQKMVAAGAKPEKIEAYIQSQGLKPVGEGDEFRGSGGGASWPEGSALNPLARGAAFGIPIIDEMGGVISKLTGGSYKAGRDDIRAREAEYRERNPGRDLALELAAGVTSGVGAVRSLGRGAVRKIVKRSPLAAAGRGAAAGAVTGAAAGAAGADGSMVSRARSAVAPAAAGLVGGGAIPGLTTAAGRVARGVTSAASRGQARLRSDELILDAGLRERGSVEGMKRWGDRAAAGGDQTPRLIDMGDEMRGRARLVEMSPSRGRKQLNTTLERRMMEMPGNVAASAERRLGVSREMAESADEIIATRQAATTRPLYEQAVAYGQIRNPETIAELQEMVALGGPFEEAWNRASRIMATNRRPVSLDAPTVEAIDLFKKSLDRVIREKTKSASPTISKGEGATFNNRLREFLEQRVDTEVPVYGQARQGWGDEQRLLDAFEMGENILQTPEREVRALVAGLTPEQVEIARAGLARAIRAKATSVADGADVTRKIFNSQEFRARLRPLFPDKKAWNEFRRDMIVQRGAAESRNAMSAGSRTATMVGEAADGAGANLADVIGLMANPASIPSRGLLAGARRISMGANENIADELADALQIQPGTEKFSQYMTRMDALNRRRQSARGRQIGAGAATGVVAGRVSGN